MRKHTDLNVLKEIDNLFEKAKEKAKTDAKASKYCVNSARKKAKHANISLEKYRKLFCHKCSSFFIPGLNCRIRIMKDKKMIKKSVKCLECENYHRYIIKIK